MASLNDCLQSDVSASTPKVVVTGLGVDTRPIDGPHNGCSRGIGELAFSLECHHSPIALCLYSSWLSQDLWPGATAEVPGE